MAPPIYFFPQRTRTDLVLGDRLNPAVLAGYPELARTFDDVGSVDQQTSISELTGPGPGGHSGCLLTALPVDCPPPLRLSYQPDWQDWKPFGSLWVGVDREHPPAPADLRRRRQQPGYQVELSGQTWQVPVIRDPDGGTWLPRAFSYQEDGKVAEKIRETYWGLWESFGKAVWLFFSPEAPWPLRMDLKEATDLCLAALSVNYRVGRIEQNLLGLVDSETWTTILAAAVDWPTFRDVAVAVEGEKKTRLSGASPTSKDSALMTPSDGSTCISPGSAADSPATDPAGPN